MPNLLGVRCLGPKPVLPSLLENRLWEPVGKGLRHRFSNRFPQTETNGIVFKTPGFSIGALCFHWYRLEIPTGTKEVATLTQGGSPFGTGWYFQPVPMTFSLFFPNTVLFVLFITVYSFIIAKRTRALQYYTFIGRSCSFSEKI